MLLNTPLKTAPAALLALALTLACFAFAGCGLNPGPAPPAYTLHPNLPGPLAGEHRVSDKLQLGINLPLADEALDNNRGAILIDNREYRYWKNATWTSQTPDLLQRWIIAAFESDGRLFVSADDANGFLADFRLASYIREFNVILGPDGKYSVALAINARLIDLRDGKISAVFNQRYEQPAAGEDLSAVMDAFDVVTGRVLSELISWTIDNLNLIR